MIPLSLVGGLYADWAKVAFCAIRAFKLRPPRPLAPQRQLIF